MAEVVALIASAATLAGTARLISNGFMLIEGVRNCPKEVENLRLEHDSLINSLENLRALLEASGENRGENSAFLGQVQTVIIDTESTLNELQTTIVSLQPNGGPGGKRAALQMRCKFFLKERSIQAILARIQARREALSLLVNIRCGSDTQDVKKQLDDIKLGLEKCLSSLHSTPSAEDIARPSTPSTVVSEGPASELSTSQDTPEETNTSISESSTPNIRVSDLARRFERGLQAGRAAGPQGERVQRRTGQLNAARSSTIATALAQGSRPTAWASNPRKGKAPLTGKVRTLAQNLSSQEASAPGIWTLASAAAAEALAKAYQDIEDLESALEYYHLALTARQALLGPIHLKTLSTLDLIAAVLELQSRWQDAIEFYELSMSGRIDNPSLGVRHPTYFPIATRIGRVYSKMGDYELALQQHASILDQYSTMPGQGGVNAMNVRADIATVHLERGDLEQGRRKAEESIAEFQALLETRQRNFSAGDRRIQEASTGLSSMKLALQKALAKANTVASPTRKDDSLSTVQPSSPSSPADAESFGNASTLLPSNTGGSNNELYDEPPDRWDSQIEAYEKQLERVQTLRGRNHPETLELMCNLAEAYDSRDQHEPAISWYLEAVHGQEITFGAKHPITLTTLHNLGVCYANNNNLSSGLEYLDRAVTGRLLKLALNHPDTLSSILQLAIVYQQIEDYAKAIEMVEKAIRGLTEKYGAEHTKTLLAEFQLAKALYKQGKLPTAQKLHEKVLNSRKAIYSPSHPLVINSKCELAVIYRDKGELPEAIALFKDIYDCQRVTFGPLNTPTRNTALNLASLCWETERMEEALEYYLVALESLQSVHEASPITYTIIMTNIGMCYVRLKKHDDALLWLQKVVAIYETEHGKEHEKILDLQFQMGNICYNSGKVDDAAGHYRGILTIREQTLPDSDDKVKSLIYHLFLCTSRSGQHEKTLAWGKRFVALGEQTDLEERLVVQRELGNIYVDRQRYTEALELYQQVMSDTKFLSEDHWLRSNIAADIHSLYAKWGDDTDAELALTGLRDSITQLLAVDPRAGTSVLVRVGYVHARQHLHTEALGLFQEALEAIQGLKPDPDLIELKHDAISGIADAHLALYNNQAALKYLETLVDSEEDGKWRHGAMIRMAGALEQDGEIEKAIDAWKRLRREEEGQYGIGSMDTLLSARKIGSLYLRIGNSNEARNWVQSCLTGLRRLSTSEAKVQELKTLGLLSSIYEQLGDLHKALVARRDCATGLEGNLGPTNEQTLDQALGLAAIYNRLGHEKEALEWYDKAIKGYKKKLGNSSVKVLNAERDRQALERRAGHGSGPG